MCRCHTHSRRTVLAMLAVTPVVGCKPQTEGPEDIRWSRETCEICGMIISDPRYATEIRGGADSKLVKFDDIGDAVHWLNIQDWKDTPKEFWVMDSNPGADWLDARISYFHPDTMSPMDYGFAAVKSWEEDAVTFSEMREAVLKKGLASRCLPYVEEAQG